MGLLMLHFLGLVLIICSFACSLPILGSAVPLVGEGTQALPSGPGLQPPLEMPADRPSSAWIISPPAPLWGLVPSGPNVPPFIIRAPAHATSPSTRPPPNEQIQAPSNFDSHQAKAPVINVPISPAPLPRIDKAATATIPVSAPSNKRGCHFAPESYSPTKGPTPSGPVRPYNRFRSSRIDRHPRVYNSAPTPEPYVIPPPSSLHSKPPSTDSKYAPLQAPESPQQTISPFISPKASPSGPSRITPKMHHLPPRLSLPPPPPQKGCGPMTCTEPYTYGPPESPCGCVLPIQVGLRLSMALYSFFPLVSQLAFEIANGVFMKQSQVRIMGANEAENNPDKTVVHIDLIPLGHKFDNTTAYITFQRFWQKEVMVESEPFGEYDVLYVKYPGLPPSPPLPPSTDAIMGSKPYLGHNGPKPVEPLGVDVSGKQHKRRLGGSILAMVVLSCFMAVFLLCAVAWVFVFRYRHHVFLPDPLLPDIVPSQVKSSGVTMSMVGSGTTTSPSFSLGSSMAAYTGAAKTFTSHDIKRATDFFNESRIIGEGGFGLVYSGVLDDGAKVAVKILKRYDHQGGREFLAEVEMLSRLHHRNLVKLIGICVEEPTQCLVYELIPNGSVESHLHGCDKERSPLNWRARLKIALGAARALAYLHEDSSPRVIHRDFKASNILLEDDFTPKVSDFGLARTALDEENRHISTRVMGTFGYVAPEYAMTGHLLVKSDVYSYGVVLLELLTGRKPVDMSQPSGQENLVSWARPLLTSPEGLELIADQVIIGPGPSPLDSISKAAAIASMCVQPEVSNRPFMGEVVQALKLICNECDENREFLSGNLSPDDFSTCEEVRASVGADRARLPAPLLSPPSTYSDYDYRMDVVERDLSILGLLSPSARFGPQESESFRRHSSSGPLRTVRAKPIWRTMRRFSRGSVSEHGARFRLWPESH